MTQTRIKESHSALNIHGGLNLVGAATLSGALSAGATTCASTVTASGVVTLNGLKLVQTMGGTATTAWGGAAAPSFVAGQNYFVFTSGASTFRVPCWPTA